MWRIHGKPNSKIAIKIISSGDVEQIKYISLFAGLKSLDTEYGGIPIQLEPSPNSTTTKEYIVDSNQATIIVDFNLASMASSGGIQVQKVI